MLDDNSLRRDRHGLEFLLAMERGDAATLGELWGAAEHDPALEDLFVGLLLPLDAPTEPDGAHGGAVSLPPRPEIIVRHNTRTEEERSDAGAVKKGR